MSLSESFLGNILLAFAWAMAHGSLDIRHLTVGFLLGFVVLAIAGALFGHNVYARKMIAILRLTLTFLWHLLIANFRVAADVLSPSHRMRPAVIAVPLDVTTDQEITLLANMITLTPGSLTLDVSKDRRVLYVHVAYAADVERARREIKDSYEAPLLRVTR